MAYFEFGIKLLKKIYMEIAKFINYQIVSINYTN